MTQAIEQCNELAEILRAQEPRAIFGRHQAQEIMRLAQLIEDLASDEELNRCIDMTRRNATNNATYAQRRQVVMRWQRDPETWEDEVQLLSQYLPETLVHHLRTDAVPYLLERRKPTGPKRPKRGKTRKFFPGPREMTDRQARHSLNSRRPLQELLCPLKIDHLLSYENFSGALSSPAAAQRAKLLDDILRRLHASIVLLIDIANAQRERIETSYTLAIGIARK